MANELGACNNRGFLSHFLGESPLTASLKFIPINYWPIVAPYDHQQLCAMATVYSEFRYYYSGVANIAMKKAMVIGEILAPKIPDAKFSDAASSRASFVTWVKYGLVDNIQETFGDYNNEDFLIYKRRVDVMEHYEGIILPALYPPTAAFVNTLTFQQAVALCYYFSLHMRIPLRTQAVDAITHAYSALSKRGQVTEEFCTKIQNSIRDELGVNIQINAGLITSLYKGYMTGVNENNAREVFMLIDHLIPDVALRLKLTLQQAAGSGLTLYVIIGRAIRKYNDFQWGRVNTLTGGELIAWENARGVIGDNEYYGFKRDLAAARSTLYKSIGYVARELLVKLNGERTLMRYAGLGGNIKNRPALDRLVAEYVGRYEAVAGDETQEERDLVPAVNVLQGNDLFA